jgi:hypothetical protein
MSDLSLYGQEWCVYIKMADENSAVTSKTSLRWMDDCMYIHKIFRIFFSNVNTTVQQQLACWSDLMSKNREDPKRHLKNTSNNVHLIWQDKGDSGKALHVSAAGEQHNLLSPLALLWHTTSNSLRPSWTKQKAHKPWQQQPMPMKPPHFYWQQQLKNVVIRRRTTT